MPWFAAGMVALLNVSALCALILLIPWLLGSRGGLIEAISLAISTFGFFATTVTTCRATFDRFVDGAEMRTSRRRPTSPKWPSFAIYVVLLVIGTFVATAESIVALGSWQGAVSTTGPLGRYGPALYHASVPAAVWALVWVVSIKTVGTHAHDTQKLITARMTAQLDRIVPAMSDLDYQGVLAEICELALDAVSQVGTAWRRRHRNATLFLVDANGFVPHVVVGGAGNVLKNALSQCDHSYFQRRQFESLYARFHERWLDESRVSRRRKKAKRARLAEFRKDSVTVVSTPGVVLGMEKKLAFDRVATRCLTTQFDCLLGNVSEAYRRRFKFMQLIGLPIVVHDRKVGVLQFTAARRWTFHTSDRMYQISANIVGAALQKGLEFGLTPAADLAQHGMPRDAGEAVAVIRVMNRVSWDFSRPID